MRTRIAMFFVCLMLLISCAGQSVRHLPRGEGQSNVTQTLDMRYLSFQYQMIELGEEIGIVAEAFPQVERLPDWASWYDEIRIAVYVSDRDGKLLATAESTLMPRPLNREDGLPVEVRFDLGTDRNQPLFISFGYRLMLADASNRAAPSRRHSLVAEGAVGK